MTDLLSRPRSSSPLGRPVGRSLGRSVGGSLGRSVGRSLGGPGGAPTLQLAAVAAGTTWVTMLCWRGLTAAPMRFLGPLLVLAVVVAGVGVLLRLARVPALGVLLAQTAAGGAVAVLQINAGDAGDVGFVSELLARIDDAMKSAGVYAPPIPSEAPGVEPLLILGGLGCLLLVDLLACTWGRVPLAGLPLLAVYAVPVSLQAPGVSWWVFVVAAIGFTGMLFLQQQAELARWGRGLNAESSGFSVRTDDIRTTATAIGASAVALALAVPLLLPTFRVTLFNGGFGPGGDENIQIKNPITDLRRDLVRGPDRPLLRVTTDEPDPSYLRIAVLARLNDEEWSSGDRDVPQDQAARGAMPALVGVSATVPRREYRYAVSTDASFDSIWLPTAENISAIEAPGDWRYDLETMDFLSGRKDQTAASMEYSFTKVDLQRDALAMSRTPPTTGGTLSAFTQLPPNLSPNVRQLARQVTDSAPNRFQRAQLLQEWFRDTGGFTYDDTNTGTGDLSTFLFADPADGGRRGYCEQFASAYAMMARTLGIPARVAVGFLQPDRIGANTYEFSTHDLHAWPELFFPGAGWVRFEPTPAQRVRDVPGYTTANLPAAPAFTPSAGTAQPSADVPSRGADTAEKPTQDTGNATGSGLPVDWVWVLRIGILLLVAAVLLVTPRVVRRWRRDRRWRTLPGPDAAWAELRDTAHDLGVRWPAARSPRTTAAAASAFFAGPATEDARPRRGADQAPEAASAMRRIVHEVELARYARDAGHATVAGLRADVETCAQAWSRGVTASARRAATWWPRSVVRPGRAAARPSEAAEVEQRDRIVDHVG